MIGFALLEPIRNQEKTGVVIKFDRLFSFLFRERNMYVNHDIYITVYSIVTRIQYVHV
mgnify:CR=1 FL=1